MTTAELADHLSELLMLAHPPVAVSFGKDPPSASAEAVEMQPAGCCYWAPAQEGRLDTKPSDHANCNSSKPGVARYENGRVSGRS